MLSIIVAVAENNVIGKDNKLIWHLPADLKRFKEITTGHTIIMGRKTFESLGRVLPNRKHVILCNDMEMNVEDDTEEHFIIGGATIYKLLMPKANKIYLTLIHEKFDGDVYFPEISDDEWKIVDRTAGITDEKNPYNYEFITYVRK